MALSPLYPPKAIPQTTKAPQLSAAPSENLVELRGIEPLTLRLPEEPDPEEEH